MAFDVTGFLWNKFLNSLQEADSELSGSNLISHFRAITDVVRSIDVMPERPALYSYSECIPLLYDLNDALAECRVFARERKDFNKKLLLFNPYTYYIIQKMKRRLAKIERDLTKLAAWRERTTDSQEENAGPGLLSKVFGFDELVGKIERLLTEGGSSQCNAGFTAIRVVGIAGVGKTALVKKVLESDRVKKEFSPIIWLPFSGIPTEDQQQSSNFTFEAWIFDNLGNNLVEKIVGVGELLEGLHQLVSGNKYLIVLDGVWDRHIDIEERLCRGLPKASGGAIIVTSRIVEVPQPPLVEPNNLVLVEPLDREMCWRIFQETIKHDKEFASISHLQALEKIKEEIKDQCHGLPLAAKALAKIIPEQIREIESNRFLEEMYVADEFLKPDLRAEPAIIIPTCPVLVFIEMKNEQLGKRLFDEFCYRLNEKQVFAVLEEDSDSKQKVRVENPEKALKEIYGTLEKLKCYHFANEIQKKMRIIIVGGDAVTNRILGVICDLKLSDSPSIVPISVGTDNSISLSFGWKDLNADRESVTSFLGQVKDAEQMKTDSWHILIETKAAQSSIAGQEISHSLPLFYPVPKGNQDNLTLWGGFWNYFSLGVDGRRRYGAYCFDHTARVYPDNMKHTPNDYYLQDNGCTSYQEFFHHVKNLNSFAEVKVMKKGQWELLSIPSSIKSILCLNLPSFRGENPWGSLNLRKDRKKHPTLAVRDDEYLEIVGSKDVLFRQNQHIRLDQVQGIHFKFEGATEVANMSIDGAPWVKIPLEYIDDIVISFHGQVNILGNGDCPAKRSIHDPSQQCASATDDDNNTKDNNKSRVKFGSTSTFKTT